YGGPAPTIFSLTTGGRLTTLHTGAYISAAMVQGRDGNIYGTVANGDGSSYGYVFRITPAGAFSVVHSFAYSDGAYPYSLILGHDGNLYGVTTLGGPGSSPSGPNTGYGTLFQIASNGAFSTVASLGATADFLTLMVQAPDGSFYGTTGFADFGPGSSLTQSIVRVTLH
ncbi:MAG TPA: choice-of-anchor tandem repeat GloVer-containing protein, partial [Nevskia sp.]|nr:choice-of-anchor tandem repeat GloVer-containing protein [Nevskia sp.]